LNEAWMKLWNHGIQTTLQLFVCANFLLLRFCPCNNCILLYVVVRKLCPHPHLQQNICGVIVDNPALNKATHDMSTQIDGLWNLDRIRTWMHMSTKTISTWRLLLYRLRITFMISSTRVLWQRLSSSCSGRCEWDEALPRLAFVTRTPT
jgi:hypothetical protein